MDKTFAEGMIIKDAKPEFVLCKVSFKLSEFSKFVKEHKTDDGWLNVDIKRSKKGGLYAELNTWKKQDDQPAPEPDFSDDDIPFN